MNLSTCILQKIIPEWSEISAPDVLSKLLMADFIFFPHFWYLYEIAIYRILEKYFMYCKLATIYSE